MRNGYQDKNKLKNAGLIMLVITLVGLIIFVIIGFIDKNNGRINGGSTGNEETDIPPDDKPKYQDIIY